MKNFLKIHENLIISIYVFKDYENKKFYMFDISKMCDVILEKSAHDILLNQIIENAIYREKLYLKNKLEEKLINNNKKEKRSKI